MPPHDYTAAYKSILLYVKSKGVKVVHREIKTGAGGTFTAHKKLITIDKRARYTLDGCFYLCHELIHFYQYTGNEFLGFFTITGAYSDDKINLIRSAEIDADTRGVLLLQKWGLSYKPLTFTKNGMLECMKFWREYYFELK